MNIDTSIFTMEKYRLKDIATVKISSVDKKKKEADSTIKCTVCKIREYFRKNTQKE